MDIENPLLTPRIPSAFARCPMNEEELTPEQAASARQFDRQHQNYGKSHVLADTSDVVTALREIEVPAGGKALDVATGGGHTALCLARAGWQVTIGDVSLRMLESAKRLLAEHGYAPDAHVFAAESMPFPDRSFDLVTVRVAPHHFSSPPAFLGEVARVLKPGGHFLLIDGTVPDDDTETGYWLNRVEKWRDTSHVQLIPPAQWRAMAEAAAMRVVRCETHQRLQPDLEWYFETAGTPPDHRRKVLDAIRTASPEVRRAMRLEENDGRVTWQWTMVTLIARAP